MNMVKIVVCVILCFGLSGCINVGCDDCEPPPESVSEMNVLGVTLTSFTTPFPKSVDEEYVVLGVEHSVTADLYMYFSPADGRELIDSPGIVRDRSRYPYEMRYSELIGESYIDIAPSENFEVLDPEAIYSGEIDFGTEPAELLGNANHILGAPQPFEAPARATHVELWFRDSVDADPQLVRRIELRSLFAWNKYLQPLIEARGSQ